jgi:hypothetical protein
MHINEQSLNPSVIDNLVVILMLTIYSDNPKPRALRCCASHLSRAQLQSVRFASIK